MECVPVTVDRVIGTVGNEFAVVVKSEEKAFLIFVGQPEALTLFRELRGLKTERPMTHDGIVNLLAGFDIEIRMIVISSIVDNVYCATLLLTQASPAGEERKEVRLDLRASDAMIIAVKTGSQLYVGREVMEHVEDVTPHLPDADEMDEGLGEGELGD